ncbi:hypothetical protein H0H87_012638 [Tephrocybe sp. NHM501043]|nr:hypothetical protein H0H87_012638 [Tephrocybe sp. NHM501043]
MAAGLSRRCIGSLGLQQGPIIALAGPSRQFIRSHAVAATVVKQKPVAKAAKPAAAGAKSVPPAAKAASATTAKAVPLSKVKIPKVFPTAATTKSASKAAVKPPTAPAKRVEHASMRRAGAGVSYRMPEKEKNDEPLTEEEQMKQLEQVMAMSKYYPTADPWGQRVETLDVMLPYSTTYSSRSDYSSWREMFDQFKQNRLNAAKNFISMLMLAQENAIPGLDLSRHKWWQKMFTVWPRRLASTTSVKENSWSREIQTSALDSYRNLNTALAQGDDAGLRSFSTDSYQDQILHLRKKQKPGYKFFWTYHREVTPARVLSIRATQGYLATDDPKFGNRMMVHALVRLDTEQSLEIYTDRGVPLHIKDHDGKPVQKRVPAPSTRVTEYFILEKRMWYDGPWLLREQLWEQPGKKPAV